MVRELVRRILICEANPHVGRLLSALIAAARERPPRLVRDAASASAMLGLESFEAILIDAAFPPQGGLALCRTLRALEGGPNWLCPVILMASDATQTLVESARDAGATEFLAKPLSPKALFDRLEAVRERPRNFIRAGTYVGPDRRRRTEDREAPERRKRAPRKVEIGRRD